MSDFETQLSENINILERFVNYKISNFFDAQDVIQETCISASNNYSLLRDKSLFKPWIIKIANNKCNDYFRKKSKESELSIHSIADFLMAEENLDTLEKSEVHETLELLGAKEKQIIYLYYFNNLSQNEISKILKIPVGTVKSRLYKAKLKFKSLYPYSPKGDVYMKNLPNIIPEYKIEKSHKPPFSVKCEELYNWMIVPRLNESLRMGIYYQPSGKMQGLIETKVIGEAEIYGIRGVEILAKEHDVENYYRTEITKENERRFIAQLTDTHCRFLAETHIDEGVRYVHTFIDDDEFTENWGFGDDNSGMPVNLSQQNLITREDDIVTGKTQYGTLDVVGRYNVTINGKTYDTVCLMDLNCCDDTLVSEQFIDDNGKTVLWRRFNKNDWAFERYERLWTEMLPQNETLTVNGETYVHWYDCISDYIL